MKNIEINDIVIVLKDKDFTCPVQHVKKGSKGRVCEVIEKNNKIGYIVEIDFDIFDFKEGEIEVINL